MASKLKGLDRIYSYRFKGVDKPKPAPFKGVDSPAMNDPFFKETLDIPKASPLKGVQMPAPVKEIKRAGFRPIPQEDVEYTPPAKASGSSYPKVRVFTGSGIKNIPNRPLSEANTPWLKKKPAIKKASVAPVKKYETEYRNPFPRPEEPAPVNLENYFGVVPKGVTRSELGLKEKQKSVSKNYSIPELNGAPLLYSNQQHEQLREADAKIGGGAKRFGSLMAIAGISAGGLALGKLLSKSKPMEAQKLLEYKPQSPKQIKFKPIQKGKNLPAPNQSGKTIEMPYNRPARAANAAANSVKGSGQPITLKAPKQPIHKVPKSPRSLSKQMRWVKKKQNAQTVGKYDGKIIKTPPSVLLKFMKNRK